MSTSKYDNPVFTHDDGHEQQTGATATALDTDTPVTKHENLYPTLYDDLVAMESADKTVKEEEVTNNKGASTTEDVENIHNIDGAAVSQHESPTRRNSNSKRGKRRTKIQCTGCQLALIILGSFCILFGLAMWSGGYQMMFDAILQQQMEIREGSTASEIWIGTPVPLIVRFYFFNITNGKRFENGKKPILKEVGPYCYREYHKKENLEYHPNHTVSFFQKRWWIWDQDCSGPRQRNDTIVSLNSIPVSSAWSVRGNNYMLGQLNDMFTDLDEKLVLYATAEETMFAGIQDPLLDWMQENMVWENGTYHPILPILPIPPGLTDYDRFGWFYKRNNSLLYDGHFTMRTGTDTLDAIGLVDMWNERRSTDFFTAPCNDISGSAGEIWPPHRRRDYIDFYSTDLCMTMKLFYKQDVTDRHGITGYRYWGSRETFSNGSVVPGNECYCVKGTCAPTGLLNAESCRMGSPAFISFPHFLNADLFLLDVSDALQPAVDKHSFYIDIIPELGTPLEVAARMQINMRLIPYAGEGPNEKGKIDILSKVPDMYLPMLWFEEVAGIDDKMASQLKMLLLFMQKPVMDIVWACIIGVGAIQLLLGLGLRFR